MFHWPPSEAMGLTGADLRWWTDQVIALNGASKAEDDGEPAQD